MDYIVRSLNDDRFINRGSSWFNNGILWRGCLTCGERLPCREGSQGQRTQKMSLEWCNRFDRRLHQMKTRPTFGRVFLFIRDISFKCHLPKGLLR